MGVEGGGGRRRGSSGKRVGMGARAVLSTFKILIILSKKRDGISGICWMKGIAWGGGGRGVASHGGRGGGG